MIRILHFCLKRGKESLNKMFLMLVTFITINHAVSLETYTSNNFSFSIDYPSKLLVNTIYEHEDSIALSNKEENVKLFVGGSTVAWYVDAYSVYQDELALIPNRASHRNEEIEVTYKRQKDRWFVISGYNHTRKSIFYTKGFVYKKGKKKLLVEYMFVYPIKEKGKYGKLINIFNKSFVFGNTTTK